ncbi:MAG: DoxX family protein [Bacteroidota bacterium]
MIDIKLSLAEALVRVFLGILFFFQGFDKLFVIKMTEVVESFMQDARRRHIPKSMVAFLTYLTSLIEVFGGLSLIFGLYSNYAMVFLSLDLVIIAFSFSIMHAMWDLKHVFPRLILMVILLILPSYAHYFCLDYLFHL